jgi:DNA transformation protein
MGVTAAEIAYAKDLFSDLPGEITTRRMMGGLCVYHDGTIFAILHPDHGLMIKGAGAFQDHLEAKGCTRWVQQRADGTTSTMPYWTLPDAAQEDPSEASAMAREALSFL